MRTPGTAISPADTAAVVAVVYGARTFRQVAERTGMSLTTTFKALHRLRDAGIVAFEDRTAGTLRAAVTPIRRVASD